MKCVKQVSDRTGFHWFRCEKTAKYLVEFCDGSNQCLCGTHARRYKMRDMSVIEIPKNWQQEKKA